MNNYLPTDYQAFIHKSRYAKYFDGKGRESWNDTVTRYSANVIGDLTDKQTKYELEQAILGQEIMPSMRAMMTAGPALDRDNTAGYNCSYLPVDDPKSFDEAMYILLCGTGVGFSVERQFISKLPEVPELFQSESVVVVKDSKEGWAKGFRQVLALLWAGEIPKWDVSQVRPAGARLKTFGGRASGPAPLVELFNFAVSTFKAAQGRKLSSMECHDLMCFIGMRHAKSGQWWETAGHRALANNSVSYTEKPDMETFMREWLSLVESKSGERGIFNREASKKQAAKFGRRDPNYEFGTNPCSEIILRPYQFCNLTECVVRATDTLEDIERKVKLATILGTIQSTMIKFPYLRKVWQNNTAEERLLGVSMTGIMDNPLMTNSNKGLENTLEHLRSIAVATNAEWAKRLGIPASASISCVKPSGTVSQLVDSASGIHARHSPYYIRTVRGDNKDPLTQFMIDQGIPNEPCVMKPDSTVVFSFPVKSPDKAVTRNDMTAVEQLELWLTYQRSWCEHKPSVTISVRDGEWMEVGAFVYKHFDEMSGVSFLPHSDHTYQQAPYQEIGKSEYKELLSLMPKSIDWSELSNYENEDNTVSMQTMACSGDSCEIVDLT
jgi:ribonucleoside-diphosphate reductase alpha chain